MRPTSCLIIFERLNVVLIDAPSSDDNFKTTRLSGLETNNLRVKTPLLSSQSTITSPEVKSTDLSYCLTVEVSPKRLN